MAVKQSSRPVSISTDLIINMIGTLIKDDGSLTQHEIAAHLGIPSKGYGTKNIEELTDCCSESHKGKFFCFCADGSYTPFA